MVENSATVETYAREWRRLSWGGIFAGTILALMIYLLLNVLGVAIGASTIDVAQGESPSASAFGAGAAIWWVASGLIALFGGGWVAGRLAAVPHTLDRALHGLVVWGALNLIVLYLLTSAVGRIVGGAASVVGQTLSTATQLVTGPGGIDFGEMIQGVTGTEGQRGNVMEALRQYLTGPQRSEEARNVLVQALVATGMSEEQANQRVAAWGQRAEQAGGRAGDVVDKAAGATTAASLWLFFSMLLGAAAAAVGATIAAAPDYVDARRLEVGAPAHRAA